MATEKGLYAQVFMIRQNYLKINKENNDKNEVTFVYKGQSARSQRSFDLGFDWIEENFSTREPSL